MEETKRRKLALKAQKLVELMMVSGIRTSSGFEERIRFTELEIVDRDAIDTGVLSTLPEGNYVNGWDVNVAGVRITSVKRNIRYHKHAVSETSLFQSLPITNIFRNFFYGLKGKGISSISLAADMETSVVFTKSYVLNCRVEFSRRCPRRTRATRRRRISSGV